MNSVFITLFISAFVLFPDFVSHKEGPVPAWVAPIEVDKLLNPFSNNVASVVEGKKTYMQICFICHGDKGKGDGLGGIALVPRPANFSSPKVQMQSDGAIFWKITEGRPPMASYKTILTEVQRWQLVNFIRTFQSIKK